MSWWFYRSGEHGTRELWAIDFDPLLTIFVLSLPVAILLFDGLLSLFLLSCGFVCLLIAKVSLFRRGVWVSWGRDSCPWIMPSSIALGYLLIGIGAFLRVFLHV